MDTIKLSNGRTAVSFAPQDSKELAIVPLSVAKRMVKHLPRVPFDRIREDLIEEISSCDNSDQLRLTLNTFMEFDHVVNMIDRYDPSVVPGDVHSAVSRVIDGPTIAGLREADELIMEADREERLDES